MIPEVPLYIPPQPEPPSVQEECESILDDARSRLDDQEGGITIPLPDGTSRSRALCLSYFLNKALQQWRDREFDCLPTDSRNSFQVTYAHPPTLILRTSQPLYERDIDDISRALSSELDNFRNGWVRKRRSILIPWAEKSFTAPDCCIKDWTDEGIATANGEEAERAHSALFNLTNDLYCRGVLTGVPFCGLGHNYGSAKVTVTGAHEINLILQNQLGVRNLNPPSRGR